MARGREALWVCVVVGEEESEEEKELAHEGGGCVWGSYGLGLRGECKGRMMIKDNFD